MIDIGLHFMTVLFFHNIFHFCVGILSQFVLLIVTSVLIVMNSCVFKLGIRDWRVNPLGIIDWRVNPLGIIDWRVNPLGIIYWRVNPLGIIDWRVNPLGIIDWRVNPLGIINWRVNPLGIIDWRVNPYSNTYKSWMYLHITHDERKKTSHVICVPI